MSMEPYVPSTKQERRFALAWARAAEEAKKRWPGKTSKQGGFIAGAMWQRATGGSPNYPDGERNPLAERDRRVAERAWDHCLDEIEKYEINTKQAREGNPYRAAKEEQSNG